jgi:hypothetical protein
MHGRGIKKRLMGLVYNQALFFCWPWFAVVRCFNAFRALVLSSSNSSIERPNCCWLVYDGALRVIAHDSVTGVCCFVRHESSMSRVVLWVHGIVKCWFGSSACRVDPDCILVHTNELFFSPSAIITNVYPFRFPIRIYVDSAME